MLYEVITLSFAGFLKYMGEDGQILIKDGKIIYKGYEIPINKYGKSNIAWHGIGGDYDYIPVSRNNFV